MKGCDDRPLTVLYALAYYHRYNGAQRGLHVVARGIRDRGHRVIVIVPGEGRATEVFREDHFDVRRLSASPELNLFGHALESVGFATKLRAALGVLRLNLRAARLIFSEKVDVVHCAEHRAALFFGIGARICRRPLVLHVVGGPGTFPRALRGITAVLATHLILVAEDLRRTLPQQCRGKATTVRRGASRPALEHGARPPTRGDLRLLQLASLDPHKGQHNLIEAVALLPSRLREQVEVVLMGETVDEAYERYVLSRAELLSVRRLRRVHWRIDPELELLTADVIVHPSVQREVLVLDGRTQLVRSGEGIPNALIEAGLAGKPTIGTRVSGIPEVIEHERTGLIVEPGDPAELARAIERLAASAAYREELGANARRLVKERFDPDAALDAIEGVYRAGSARRRTGVRRFKRC